VAVTIAIIDMITIAMGVTLTYTTVSPLPLITMLPVAGHGATVQRHSILAIGVLTRMAHTLVVTRIPILAGIRTTIIATAIGATTVLGAAMIHRRAVSGAHNRRRDR